MKFATSAVAAIMTVGSVSAFMASPMSTGTKAFAPRSIIGSSRPLAAPLHMSFDPSHFSSILLSDDIAAVADQVGAVASEAAKTDQGWFGFLTYPIAGLLQLLHSTLVGVGVSSNAWGISIIFLTVLIKCLTYPLTAAQLESTNKMQVLQPKIKEIQNTYASNPQVMNEKVAAIYQEEQVNPLAGCLPAIVQLPVFIGLYRAILELAKGDKLSEPFLFLPNLEGPTYGADPASGSDWILKNWVDGVPALGWDDTKLFLILPVALVISQYISQALITPKNQDPSQQQANTILKVLPLMIGWFSLNVPAALGIYWVANNIITTAITMQIRSGLETAPAAASGGSSATTVEPPSSNAFRPAPMREKPSGFAAAVDDPDTVKPITTIDAEIISESTDAASTNDTDSETKPKKRGGGKKKKKGGKK